MHISNLAVDALGVGPKRSTAAAITTVLVYDSLNDLDGVRHGHPLFDLSSNVHPDMANCQHIDHLRLHHVHDHCEQQLVLPSDLYHDDVPRHDSRH